MQDRFDSVEFEVVEYMATSGGLGAPDSDARITYYGNNGLPHLLFNGGGMVVGAGTDVIDGSTYDPIVRSLLDEATPLKLAISDYNFNAFGAAVTVDLELEGDLADISQTHLRVAILEDDLTYGGVHYHNILRDILPDQDLSISSVGQSEQITINFNADSGWNVANLRLVAFVQNDQNKEILQTCNSRAVPDYSLRYYVMGDRNQIGEDTVMFGETGLFNTGSMTDTYDISVDSSNLPGDWSASFTYDGSDYSSLSLPLDPGARALLNVNVQASSTGEGEVTLILHSQSGQMADREITFKVITPDINILLVDDDGPFEYETLYFGPAIESAGKAFATWDRASSGLDATVLDNFDLVIWSCGWAFPTVDADDRAALTTYLENGGNLFITGQDIGWELYDEGGAARTWYNNYLHADYVADDTNMLSLQGVAGDPITEGLSLSISGGDGANNQEYPSDIDPRGAYASTILTYDASRNGGVKADTGVYKVVYLSFGYEAINNAADRAALMQGIINWMIPGEAGTPDGLPSVMVMHGNVPNPFNPQTEIKFTLPSEAHVRLGVFDLKGRHLRNLDAGVLTAGEHGVMWDGTDDSGRALPSGTYFCRVLGAGTDESVKMMLVR